MKKLSILTLTVGKNPIGKGKSLRVKNSHKKIQTLTEDKLSKKFFYFAGRLMRKRPMGKAAFFTLQDEGGQFQCYIRKDSFANQDEEKEASPIKQSEQLGTQGFTCWDLWKLADIGDIFALKGQLFTTQKGEPSLKVLDLKILCKSLEPLPEKYHGLEDKELKYRFRHLDLLMNPETKKIFKTRSQIISEIRKFMNKSGFMEVETPVLQPLYGGAVAEPFETYFRRLGHKKMYLKISPEIYLKKLVVGGFEKVYEIGKNFRNEGIDRTHNPEFTMMEYYQAYTDYRDQMKFFKKLVNKLVKKVKGSLTFEYQGKELNFKKWETLTLKQAIKKYSQQEQGLYESFVRVKYKENQNIPQFDSESQKAFELNVDELSFSFLLDLLKEHYPKADYRAFEWKQEKWKNDQALSNPSRSNQTHSVQSMTSQAPQTKRKEEEEILKEELIVMAFELIAEKHLWNPTFIIDFPLAVSPLTKIHRKNKKLVERFEPYIAGMELGNAYTELNDPMEQRKRLESQQRWSQSKDFQEDEGGDKDKDFQEDKSENKESLSKKTESTAIDENFLHALEVGMPPTGGVGLGIERLVMILTNQKSIRDCILFPAQKTELSVNEDTN